MPARCKNLRKCANLLSSSLVKNRARDFRLLIKCRWSRRLSAVNLMLLLLLLFKSWQHSSKLAKAWSSLFTMCLAKLTSGSNRCTTRYWWFFSVSDPKLGRLSGSSAAVTTGLEEAGCMNFPLKLESFCCCCCFFPLLGGEFELRVAKDGRWRGCVTSSENVA